MFNPPKVVGKFGGTEVRAAHGAILAIGMTSLSEILQGQFGVERQVELVAPAELETGLRQGVVADGGTWMPLSQIGCMGSYLIGYDTRTNIVFIRQARLSVHHRWRW